MSIAIDFENVFITKNDADNFSAQVFRLIAKADDVNIEKLRLAFPVHVGLYEWWMAQDEWRAPLISLEKVVADLTAAL